MPKWTTSNSIANNLNKLPAAGIAVTIATLSHFQGVDLTLEEAEAYLAEMDDIELDKQQLKAVAGGWDCGCDNDCNCYNDF